MISPIAARKAARAIATRECNQFDTWTMAPVTTTVEWPVTTFTETIDRAALNGQTLRGVLAHAKSKGAIDFDRRPVMVATEINDGRAIRLDLQLRGVDPAVIAELNSRLAGD